MATDQEIVSINSRGDNLSWIGEVEVVGVRTDGNSNRVAMVKIHTSKALAAAISQEYPNLVRVKLMIASSPGMNNRIRSEAMINIRRCCPMFVVRTWVWGAPKSFYRSLCPK